MIQTYKNPPQTKWEALIKRPSPALKDIYPAVQSVFDEIVTKGDRALARYTLQFDRVKLDDFRVSEKEFEAARSSITAPLQKAIQAAYENITKFHRVPPIITQPVETVPGVCCWQESRPIEQVGIYIPGGSAPLFSTVLMLGIPARLAGCRDIILCTPPDREGKIHPAILYAARLVGLRKVFKAGGMQAIGAMTFGTESIPKVYKIFGPGNPYVMAAKQAAQRFGIAIDLPAGPSEVLVIADDTANAAFVASDLLSQAEHGADSQVILLTPSSKLSLKVTAELRRQLPTLPRKEIIQKALGHSKIIVLESVKECLDLSNAYAPEHLILAVKNPKTYLPEVRNAGSVFLGNYSCESAGDYASGTNHTLPTNGYAKAYSGVSLDSFMKRITFQEITPEGVLNIGQTVSTMAEAEQLEAHKNAMTLRLKSITKK